MKLYVPRYYCRFSEHAATNLTCRTNKYTRSRYNAKELDTINETRQAE